MCILTLVTKLRFISSVLKKNIYIFLYEIANKALKKNSYLSPFDFNIQEDINLQTPNLNPSNKPFKRINKKNKI